MRRRDVLDHVEKQ